MTVAAPAGSGYSLTVRTGDSTVPSSSVASQVDPKPKSKPKAKAKAKLQLAPMYQAQPIEYESDSSSEDETGATSQSGFLQVDGALEQGEETDDADM